MRSCANTQACISYLHALIFDKCLNRTMMLKSVNWIFSFSVSAFSNISINRSFNNVFLWNHTFLMQRTCRKWEKHCCQCITKYFLLSELFCATDKKADNFSIKNAVSWHSVFVALYVLSHIPHPYHQQYKDRNKKELITCFPTFLMASCSGVILSSSSTAWGTKTK